MRCVGVHSLQHGNFVHARAEVDGPDHFGAHRHARALDKKPVGEPRGAGAVCSPAARTQRRGRGHGLQRRSRSQRRAN